MAGIASVKTYTIYDQASGTYDLYAQRLDGSGHAIGGPTLVSSPAYPDYDGSPGSAVVLKTGDFYVVYGSADPDSTFGDLSYVVQQVDGNGALLGGPAVIASENYATTPTIDEISLDNGGFVFLVNTRSNSGLDQFYTQSELVFGLPNGKTVYDSVAYFDDTPPSGPYPFLGHSSPVIQRGPNDTITVSYQESYVKDPDDSSVPSGSQQFMRTYNDSGQLIGSRFVDFDHTAETYTYDPATGKELTGYTRHPDGSFDTEAYGIAGKPYADQEASYGVGGHLVHMTRHYADGSLAFEQTVRADGSQTVGEYDPSRRETTSIAIAGDHSREVVLRTYTGSATTPTTIEHDFYGAAGAKLRADLTNADGTHRQTAYAAGVTLTTTPGTDDVLVGASAGGDTFVFGKALGQDIVLGFKPGSSAGHDVIDLGATGIADYQHLQGHLSHVAVGTEITLDDHSTILLRGISPEALTSADFVF